VILALRVGRDIDLGPFSMYLRQHGINHRINEAGEQQELWVVDDVDESVVRDSYAALQRGDIQLEVVKRESQGLSVVQRLIETVWRVPVTMVFIIVTGLLFPVTLGIETGEVGNWFQLMNFVSFDVVGDRVYFNDLEATLVSGDYWRLLTPMFLHFGVLHIVFNMLWFWEIGRRIEVMNGGLLLVTLVLTSSLSSNLLQYYMTGPGFFGGMSGVVFGLLGFGLVWSRLIPSRDIGLPNAIYGFMLGFLVIGFSGVFDLLGLGSLANWAHLGGVIAGAGVGLVWVGVQKITIR
jgi:GlpG protein